MPKAKVSLPDGTDEIRIHRVDNTFFTLKHGDTVELDDVPGRQREERLMSGHFKPISDAAPTKSKPEKGEEPKKGDDSAATKGKK